MAAESLGIRRIAALHVFVRDLERSRDHYVNNLGFTEIARSTEEFELEQRARACVVEAGLARFVFLEPLGSKGESFAWLQRHPEGVGRVVFDVENVDRCFALLTSRGATPATGIERRNVEGEVVSWFDIATPVGDTLFRFVDRPHGTPIMPDLVRVAVSGRGPNPFGVSKIDHLTFNFLTLKPVLTWMEEVLGFERFWEVEFHTQDVKSGHLGGSGLKSVVMRDPVSGINFATNEPYAPRFKASQIYVFCQDHRGPGIQHVALEVGDILSAARGMRERGVGFMRTPGTYYDMLPDRLRDIGVESIDENIEELRQLEILVDGRERNKYLLQIFMNEAAVLFSDPQGGPVFVELIQRKGDPGFGGGNFRALFESIERVQEAEGRT